MQFLKLISITVLVVLLASECFAVVHLYGVCYNTDTSKHRRFGRREPGDSLLFLYSSHKGAGVTYRNSDRVKFPTNSEDRDKYEITYISIDDNYGDAYSCTSLVAGGPGESHVDLEHTATSITSGFYAVVSVFGKSV